MPFLRSKLALADSVYVYGAGKMKIKRIPETAGGRDGTGLQSVDCFLVVKTVARMPVAGDLRFLHADDQGRVAQGFLDLAEKFRGRLYFQVLEDFDVNLSPAVKVQGQPNRAGAVMLIEHFLELFQVLPGRLLGPDPDNHILGVFDQGGRQGSMDSAMILAPRSPCWTWPRTMTGSSWSSRCEHSAKVLGKDNDFHT